MPVTKLLIANRGEIAVRIARAAADLGLPSVAVYSADDANSFHHRAADEAVALPGSGFLAERADFARQCAAAGLAFVGPDPAHLELFGDKARARTAAVSAGVP